MAGRQDLAVLKFKVLMAKIPLCTGHSPKHWHKSINIILEKLPGNNDMTKPCIIHLFKVDFNINNKWLGKTAIAQAEVKGLIAQEQYGSWKAKATISKCWNKHLSYDHMCFQRELTALCSNNTKSCYNRIVLLAAALCLCCWGASSAAVTSMVTTLHLMTHHIRMVFSDSTHSEGQSKWTNLCLGLAKAMVWVFRYGMPCAPHFLIWCSKRGLCQAFVVLYHFALKSYPGLPLLMTQIYVF